MHTGPTGVFSLLDGQSEQLLPRRAHHFVTRVKSIVVNNMDPVIFQNKTPNKSTLKIILL